MKQDEPAVAPGEAVEPLDRVEQRRHVARGEQHAEVAVPAEALEQARTRHERLAGLRRSDGRLGAFLRDGGEAAGEFLACRGEQLSFARGDLEPQLEALELLGVRRLFLLAFGEPRSAASRCVAGADRDPPGAPSPRA